ncbi:hypothetical protein P8625_01125 [Tenacibaculum tangerinum]|uniref:Uncharacterized protein n=1 Tax=Tenacibaculum tangerinum TaxID=3038772 RepID=A0ABY8L6T9_9FLAO|nr:hypothetical protein [Tenacibaculum tangerinum]WGH75794.1 hypothetical protein P8625_01125 [Tenacibaculum tangerinum]
MEFNHFSIEDFFWIQIKPHLISFGSRKIPKDVHFTLSFNKNSGYINLHLTRNIQSRKLLIEKPKIEIVRVEKDIFSKNNDELVNQFLIMFLNIFLTKIDINKFKKLNYGFLSNKKNDLKEEKLLNKVKEISEIRKKKIKVKGNIKERIEDLVESMEMQNFLEENLIPLDLVREDTINSGMLINEEGNIISVIKIYETWFELNIESDISVKDLLKPILGELNADYLINCYERAISIIGDLNSYEESVKWSKPLVIKLKEEYKNDPTN